MKIYKSKFREIVKEDETYDFDQLKKVFKEYTQAVYKGVDSQIEWMQDVKKGFQDQHKKEEAILNTFIKNPSSKTYSDVINGITGPNSGRNAELVGDEASEKVKDLLDKIDKILKY